MISISSLIVILILLITGMIILNIIYVVLSSENFKLIKIKNFIMAMCYSEYVQFKRDLRIKKGGKLDIWLDC